jgi:hypothetical protein
MEPSASLNQIKLENQFKELRNQLRKLILKVLFL